MRAREGRHPGARNCTLRHRLEAQVLIRRASLGGRHFAPVPLQDFSEREPLRDAPIDDNAFVDLGFDATGPLLGLRPVIEAPGLRGRPVRRIFTRQNWPRFSMVPIGQFS